MREKRKDRKSSEDPHQAGRDGRNRSRLGDQKPGPRIEKSRQRPVGVADIHILAPRLRLHSAQFGISERAEKREQPPDHPGEIHKSRRPHRLHHLGGNQKNSAPDDRPHHDGAGMRQPQVARQFRAGDDCPLHAICARYSNCRDRGDPNRGSRSSAISAVQAFASFLHRTLAAYPTAKVTQVPIATHQVNATCDHPHKYNSIANPQIMPTIAPR